MSAESQRKFIETNLLGSFKAAWPDYLVVINNVKAPKDPSKYIEYTDMVGEARQGELVPNGFDRTVGVLQIDIMVPENEGTGEITRIGDWFKALFSRRGETLSDNAVIKFRVGSHRYLGESQEMARQSFRIGYYRDDRKQSSA